MSQQSNTHKEQEFLHLFDDYNHPLRNYGLGLPDHTCFEYQSWPIT